MMSSLKTHFFTLVIPLLAWVNSDERQVHLLIQTVALSGTIFYFLYEHRSECRSLFIILFVLLMFSSKSRELGSKETSTYRLLSEAWTPTESSLHRRFLHCLPLLLWGPPRQRSTKQQNIALRHGQWVSYQGIIVNRRRSVYDRSFILLRFGAM